MDIIQLIQNTASKGLSSLFGIEAEASDILLSPTRKEFEGDYTIVVFPYAKTAKLSPDALGQQLGDFMVSALPAISNYNVVKGFLNLVVADTVWNDFLESVYAEEKFGYQPSNGQKVMVEYCSPNTNKPIHLGHIRNILLGWSSYKILSAAGYEVVRVQIINDRGVAICKSMLAWEKFGGGATPASTGIKGDHFVGDYYVLFEQKSKAEYEDFQFSDMGIAVYEQRKKEGQSREDFFKGYKNQWFNEYSELGREVAEMLRKWESGDSETVALWKQMNAWVYEGFEETFKKLGISFDKYYYESDTYLLGKSMVEEGLQKGHFYKKEDGSIWINLEDVGMDQKVLLRKDGTSVYITQDMGTARLRYNDFGISKMVYVVADEQNYHFQALIEVLKKMGEPYADGLFHLSYGMVELPSGRMKSREGTVVDADDLIAEVVKEAREGSAERGTLDDLSIEAKEDIIRQIALAALKYHIIKVQPQKRMVFDPKESVDLQGQTGPYIQNAYVRIRSVMRKAADETIDYGASAQYSRLEAEEKEIVRALYEFPELIRRCAADYDPSPMAAYAYNLAKMFHRFYHDHQILRADNEPAKAFRLKLAQGVGNTLKSALDLLGIEMPEKM
jgi:arginyl-tRNA synthetase